MYSKFGGVPVSGDVLKTALGAYKSPQARIKLLQRRGELIPLRRDLYLCTEPGREYARHLVANHMLPSYVSYESALSQAGMIPERVYTVKSACKARGREISNATGCYRYIQVPDGYFNLGLTRGQDTGGHYYMLATPAKALCDLVLATPGLRLQSAKAVREYLCDNLRMEPESVAALDADIIRACAAATNKKKRELQLLEKVVRNERI